MEAAAIVPFSAKAIAAVDTVVEAYKSTIGRYEKIREVLVGDLERNEALMDHLHSIRSRVKDPDHLREKIFRKADKYFRKDERLLLTPDNLPFMITDLVGVRLIHLYTRQFEMIKDALGDCLHDNLYVVREGPVARVWDSEQLAYYTSINVEAKDSPNLYSSVHYVVSTSTAVHAATAELQVRTLADELWGEVDHLINYPEQHADIACREQIAVLARITSAASRLTDSIFLSHNGYQASIKDAEQKTEE